MDNDVSESRFLVAASKQSVMLCRLLAADAHLTRLQDLQGGEGDAETLGSHGRSSRLQILVPTRGEKHNLFNYTVAEMFLLRKIQSKTVEIVFQIAEL